MKVITASTPEQHEYVQELIEDLYDEIFPCYFTSDYIQELKNFNLMKMPPDVKELSLAEIMEVTAAIQTISTILKEKANTEKQLNDYKHAFNRNASILSKYQIDFPFQLADFQIEH
ncbi:hypothetical protein GH741_07205 [Aquibacillus halophilus]|uniref:Uncharacterized protein n=1 Tax=Aquibacillus halophilus TaxID=930132 RepID=A0A6A8DAY9_9BACI|nr:DUF5365 family protein [Aquibacillus halophilus]MRH42470.1 hypothetical protein [Aquibacillus halophilus]